MVAVRDRVLVPKARGARPSGVWLVSKALVAAIHKLVPERALTLIQRSRETFMDYAYFRNTLRPAETAVTRRPHQGTAAQTVSISGYDWG